MDDLLWKLLAASIAIAALLALYAVFRMAARRNSNVVEASPHEEVVHLRCPRCQAAMAPGFIMAGRGITWRRADERPIGAFTTLADTLENTLSVSIGVLENRAWRCEPCKLLLVDHSTLVKPAARRA